MISPTDIPAPMAGHAARVAAYEASREIYHETAPLRRAVARPRREVSAEARQFTGAQRLKRWQAESDMALNRRVAESPLWDRLPRTRRSWSSRLRELELHPERVDAIRARLPRHPRFLNETVLDEVSPS